MGKLMGEGLDWLVALQCNTMNVIHLHALDRYNYVSTTSPASRWCTIVGWFGIHCTCKMH